MPDASENYDNYQPRGLKLIGDRHPSNCLSCSDPGKYTALRMGSLFVGPCSGIYAIRK